MKGPLGRGLQRIPGGWGITADDVYAGLAANSLMAFFRRDGPSFRPLDTFPFSRVESATSPQLAVI